MSGYRRITSFVPRGGRIPDRQKRNLERHGDTYIIDAARDEYTLLESPDLTASFGREAPLIVEIGAGAGDQVVAHAAQHPENNYLAFEVWWPGVASAVSRIVREGVTNVRLISADAVLALPLLFGSNPKPVEVWTFFPDPWPKARHHKRRMITPDFARIVADTLPEGGIWRLATDWDDYAWQMRDSIAAVPELINPHLGERIDDDDPAEAGISGGFAPRWEGRIITRFETRGLDEGRRIHDLEVRRG